MTRPRDLLAAVRERREEPLIWAVVEAMAGGETAFFRDRAPFQNFRGEMVPNLLKSRGKSPIRVWSAACGTGQEIFSLAMMVGELVEADPALRIELAASDLSRCRRGAGPEGQLQPVRGAARPAHPRSRALLEKDGEQWRLSEEVQSKRVRWRRRINLIAGLRQIGRFDIVFCRYVLGHMTEDAQRKVLEDLTCVVPPDGFLVLGAKEQVAGLGETFQPDDRPPRASTDATFGIPRRRLLRRAAPDLSG